MNIYYTAKDIEELVAKGIHKLELGPNTSLTDFARETAEQLDMEIVVSPSGNEQLPPAQAPSFQAPQPRTAAPSLSYNKPRGCQPEGKGGTSPVFQRSAPPRAGADQSGSTPVNRLVDLMGKIVKRGA